MISFMSFSKPFVLSIVFALTAGFSYGQITGIPDPGPKPQLQLPEVVETTLDNGLRVVVVRKPSIPLVTARMLVKSGASTDPVGKSGVARMTADMLLKGAAYRSGSEIAEQIDFMGIVGSSNADFNGSSVMMSMTTDKLGRGLSILADSVVRPNFPKDEFLLLKSQRLDGIKVNMKQSGSVLRLVASTYSFGERPVRGTANSIARIRRADLMRYHRKHYAPNNATLIFTGAIDPQAAIRYARLFFGSWRGEYKALKENIGAETISVLPPPISRILVLDMPTSSQAAVGFANQIGVGKRIDSNGAYVADVMNSILGSGYSSRLNKEIRIKQGLSYGVGSSFQWRATTANFISVAQTKNETAAKVADLMRIEVSRMINEPVNPAEMRPRKAVVAGRFSRALQTNQGLSGRLANLYLFGQDAKALEEFLPKVEEVSSARVQSFAKNNLSGGDLIIAGNSKMFMQDLRKTFPDTPIEIRRGSQPLMKGRILK